MNVALIAYVAVPSHCIPEMVNIVLFREIQLTISVSWALYEELIHEFMYLS